MVNGSRHIVSVFRRRHYWPVVFFLAVAFVSLSPSLSYAAADLCLSGWGDSFLNGTWTYGGVNSFVRDYWVKDSHYLNWMGSGVQRWGIWSPSADDISGALWYEDPPEATIYTPVDVPTANWTINGGTLPKGTIAVCSSPTPTPTPSPSGSTTPIVSSTYIFLYTSMIIFLLQELAILVIFLIVTYLIGWPIRYFFRGIRDLIRRAEY